jgi:hypothetical protein
LEKPVTFFPWTKGKPSGAFVRRNTPGPWHTATTGLPAAYSASIRAIESLSPRLVYTNNLLI